MATVAADGRARKVGQLVLCERCDGIGREGKGLGRRPCRACDGRGKACVGGEDVWDLDVFAALRVFGAKR